MYATYEVPYSKSDPDQVTVESSDTGITSDDTITTILVIVVCGVVVIFGTVTVTIALRKKTCRPKATEEEGDQQQNSSHYTAVLDKTEDDANYCEINQLEDGRVASDTKLQTFSSPEPDVTPVSNTTHVGNIYLNTRAVVDESEHEYTVIKCDSETTIGHDSATEYCRKKTDDYVNCKTLTTTGESGNEYEIIKY
ncbi:uncharacterized protein LOC123559541 isoform X2 [Mercenaria mercenaria]|uniref:uncharacterized protein LOC123559541 isoform X2 n=1 Tax=Mercenaria mercenaria TaxID=6596 RepID=UPI00234F6F96|nr:uncharacterized protein LOC123559541 isoform X2 [Mercenaria mercenaria]XP_053408571.1 uncharacterized protein LOC123559541 isoform X2 [Mercenaria mercenaria]